MAKKNIDLGKLGAKKEVVRKPVEDTADDQEVIDKIHKAKDADKNKEDVTRITVDVPDALHTRMKMKVFTRKITIRSYILGLIKNDLDKQ